MAATFTETLHVYYPLLKAQGLAELVERYQPDLVLVTAVERHLRSDFFQTVPLCRPMDSKPPDNGGRR
ncbi:hypothetical protein PYV50_18040 [Pseudomonas sp. H22_DOA]|nr:hypothetical protein PYV50_18040 [Pseudomonas sp. H22_DOA]